MGAGAARVGRIPARVYRDGGTKLLGGVMLNFEMTTLNFKWLTLDFEGAVLDFKVVTLNFVGTVLNFRGVTLDFEGVALNFKPLQHHALVSRNVA